MAALTPGRRAFVLAVLDQGDINYTKAYMQAFPAAGYQTANVDGPRLAHDERVLEAFHEEAQRRIRSGVALASSVLVEIAGDVTHKDRLKAVSMILNRAGLHELSEHKVTVERPTDEVEIKQRIVALAKELGLDPKVFLGHNTAVPMLPPVIDAEFAVIESSREGLEDIL